MDGTVGPSGKFMKSSGSSVCIVLCLIVTSLSLNFFTKPAACSLRYAAGEMHANACDCCSRDNSLEGGCHNVLGKSPGMCCRRGMCRITNPGVIPSHVRGSATIDLQLSTFAHLPPTTVRPFREHKLNPVSFLLGEEKDHPPEAS